LQRWLNRDPLGESADPNVFRYAFNCPLLYNDADGLSGYLVIYSDSGGGLCSSFGAAGHSGIKYNPDGGITKQVSTYGNNPHGLGNGLHENLDSIVGTTRQKYIDDAAEKRLMDKIKEYEDKGKKGWSLFRPCSTFACDAWKAATGEKLPHGIISNPASLEKAIKKANCK
jgi:hypothetical protein